MKNTKKTYQTLFKKLSLSEKGLQEKIQAIGKIEWLNENKYLLKQEQYIHSLVFVLEGQVRVWQESDWREMSLYAVRPYETCVLSLAATFRDCKSSIYAKTILPTRVLKIPVRFITAWFYTYKSWNRFVLDALINGYEDLLNIHTKLAFKTVSERLKDFLYQEVAFRKSKTLQLTHQAIANEIGTSREVISRTLKNFEEIGLIERAYKKIRVVT